MKLLCSQGHTSHKSRGVIIARLEFDLRLRIHILFLKFWEKKL
ncbi:hypothetical protein CsSME_00024249 [Camellia sinensis var. sinensis]